ncbi:MAG: TetR family transcriptional regulator [Lachnospiraceae bacterium]|nr:TetR family transcriptional regulator [Lachnospiraceae bacterium]MCR5083576.1 TetR/AcrR family transcriptional regulator C-terminal domain-containing protein [Parasporobacterium sp.]
MEQIKELTKQLISNSFKELMQKYPFEKITIKMITDAAHIIRPTFYNHFHDKYELVEWIFEDEIINKIRDDIKTGGLNVVKIMTSALAEDMDYYKKLFEVHGQNNFTEIFEDKFTELLFDVVKEMDLAFPELGITKEEIARFYAMQISAFVKFYIQSNGKMNMEKAEGLFAYFMTHSIIEMFIY